MVPKFFRHRWIFGNCNVSYENFRNFAFGKNKGCEFHRKIFELAPTPTLQVPRRLCSPAKNFCFEFNSIVCPDFESATIFSYCFTVLFYKSLKLIFEFRICGRKIVEDLLCDIKMTYKTFSFICFSHETFRITKLV